MVNSACKIASSPGEVLLLLRRASWALSIAGSWSGKVDGEWEMKANDLFSTNGESCVSLTVEDGRSGECSSVLMDDSGFD